MMRDVLQGATQDVLILRFEAPLMSFGGPIVDHIGATERFPGVSMIAGLLANALGWTHAQSDQLNALQRRLRHAAVCVRPGRQLVDFHTVDLGQPHLSGTGWTTWNEVEERKGASGESTHIRERHYIADASYLVGLTLAPADASPTLSDVEQALRKPARPLFLGRKCCIPSGPVLERRVQAHNELVALESELARLATSGSARRDAKWEAKWEAIWGPWCHDEQRQGMARSVTDERDWANQVHVGRRTLYQGWLRAGGQP